MKMILHPLSLALAQPFRISRGMKTQQEALVVELRDNDISAWGEAAAHPYFGAELSKMIAVLEAQRERIEAASLDDPSAFWAYMKPLLAEQPMALSALDMAVWDLWSRRKGQTLREALQLPAHPIPDSNITLGLDPIPDLLAKLHALDWPIYKVKLGGAHDMESMRAIREHTDSLLRIDANGGWTAEQCLAYAPQLAEMGVEFIEQPLAAEDWAGMDQIYDRSPLPLIADESCRLEEDVARCAERFDGINIKLAKCGGISPALRMLAKARELGLKCMMGCMIESRIGTSAIAQLLPLLDAVDMDGPTGLRHRYAEGVELDRGKVIFPAGAGTGASLLPAYRS
ncbi:MAG: dipeptide epimerase [Bacteroidota bacterium]